MSFKIVQEIYKRGYVLVIIPEAFEENNVFWYPPSNLSTKSRNAIIKNAFAQPDKAVWVARPCKVKRKNIKSFEIAEQEEEELLAKLVTTATESEREESDGDDPKATRYRNPYSARSPQQNFEELVESCIENEGLINIRPILVNASNEEKSFENDHLLDISHNVAADNQVYVLQNDNSSSTLETILSNQDTILKNQELIIDEVNNIKKQINSGFSKIFTQIEQLVKGGCVQEQGKIVATVSAFSIQNFNKIGCFEEAQALENSLKAEEYLTNMVSQMAYIVGKGGNRSGDGWTCCYELIDAFFKRSFLALCSWTGASTSKEDGKIPFLSFKNIILCYSKIITNADLNFSLSQTQDFFKSLLRNSTRFINQESSQTRKSSKRSRTKMLKNISKRLKVPDSEAGNSTNQAPTMISKNQSETSLPTSPKKI